MTFIALQWSKSEPDPVARNERSDDHDSKQVEMIAYQWKKIKLETVSYCRVSTILSVILR